MVLLLAMPRLLDARDPAASPSRVHAPTTVPAESTPPVAHDRSLILGFSPFGKAAVRRAIDRALAKLARPGCTGVYAEFELRDGGTPRRVLDAMGIGPQELLDRLVFVEGSRLRACQNGCMGLRTTPGSFVIQVCPKFVDFYLREPDVSADLIIHESLHTLGLGEDPPSSREITARVRQRCWISTRHLP